MRWIRDLNNGRLWPCFIVAILAALTTLSVAQPVSAGAWPDGWSKARHIGSTIWHHGHRTAANTQGQVWFAMVEGSERSLNFQLKLLNLNNETTIAEASLPITHMLRGYSIATGSGSAWLSWIEREEGVLSTLWLAEVQANGTVSRQPVWQSSSVADTPEIVIGEGGLLYIAFTSPDSGLAAVRVLCWDTKRNEVAAYLQLTDDAAFTRDPVIAVRGEELHLAYVWETVSEAYSVYQRHNISTGQMTASVSLGRAPAQQRHTPSLLPASDGTLHIIWQAFAGVGDRVIGGGPAYGAIMDGRWVSGPHPLESAHRGRITGVKADFSEDGTILACWSTESDRIWQVYAAVLDSAGSQIESGFATLAPGNVMGLHPIRIGQHNLISFGQMTPTGLADVAFVQTDLHRRMSLAFLVGLDTHNPLADVTYKYFSLLIGSVVIAFTAAAGSLIIALMVVVMLTRCKFFSPTWLGQLLRFLTLFAGLVALKRPGSILYFGAIILPGPAAVISWVGAAAFSLAIVYCSGMNREDLLVQGSAGLLFLMCDAFVSLYVSGVGRW